jgi:signal transduction histidine kinase/ligand-binding sensor domain-containing protein/CheY-like chemotaxis protein
MRRVGWMICLFAVANAAPAADLALTPLVETYGIADGLPSSRAQALAQDRDGYLWVATRGGLARFDGVEFRTWRHDPKDPASLASEDVQVLFVDRDNRLWIGGDGGLSMLDAARARVVNGNAATTDQPLAGGDVWSLEQDASGAIWVGTYARGLQRLDANGGAPLVLRHVEGDASTIAADDVVALELDDRARLWVGTSAGLSLLDPGTATRPPRVVAQFLPGELIVSLRADAQGNLWVGTRRGAQRRALDADDATGFTPYELPRQDVVRGIAFDEAGRPWFATSRGAVYAPDDAARITLARDDLQRMSLPSNLVWDVLRDRDGGFWFALNDSGLAYLAPNWKNFSVLRARLDPAATEPEPAPRVLASCADGNIITAATSLTALRFDPRTAQAVRVSAPWPEDQQRPLAVHGVACTADGAIWLSHRDGLVRYRPDTRESTTWRTNADDAALLAPGLIDILLPGPDGALWVSSRGGGVQRIGTDGTVRRYVAGTDGPASLEQEALVFASDGALWTAGERGLARYDASADRFVAVTGVADARVDGLAFADDGSVWYHQRGELMQARADGVALTTLATLGAAQGLPPAEAGGLVRDAQGALWLSGPRGLWRIDARTRAVRGYGRPDALYSGELSDAPPLVAPDGIVYVASSLGVIGFDPSRLREITQPPPVVLQELSIWRDGARRSLEATRALTLQHSDRDLRVVVRALALGTPRENRYGFRLTGFDSDWVGADGDGVRVFSQLPEGEYTLEARGAGPFTAWSAAPLALAIAVPPPPWRSTLAFIAYGLLVLAAAALLLAAYRQRIERRHALALAEERRQSAELQNQAKSDFLADVGHEIRTPMSGLLGMNELLLRSNLDARQREFAEAVRTSGAHLLKLINDLLDLSRIEAGRLPLDPAPFDLWALVDEVITVQRPLAAQRGLALTAQFAPDTPRDVLGDAVRVKEILLNLINNALKFTERGRVDVRIAVDPARAHGVLLEVSDTGPGMSADAVARLFARFEQASSGRRRGGSGLGLAITRRLVELMDGDVQVESRPGHGSLFRARILLPPAAVTAYDAPHGNGTVPLSLHGALDVLVVEDDPTIRRVLDELLRSLGHRVATGANGLDALRLIAEQRFDLALFDLDLPGVDGLKLIRLVRQRENGSGTRLRALAVTANSTAGIELRAREAGFDGFVRKPITLAMLQAAVAEVAH